MASSTIALNDHAAVSNTFTLRGQSSLDASYIDTDTTLAFPLGFTVKHTVPPVGSKANDRHVITFSQSVATSSGGVATGSVKVEISMPRDSAFTEVMMRALCAYTANYLTDARVQNLVDGITP